MEITTTGSAGPGSVFLSPAEHSACASTVRTHLVSCNRPPPSRVAIRTGSRSRESCYPHSQLNDNPDDWLLRDDTSHRHVARRVFHGVKKFFFVVCVIGGGCSLHANMFSGLSVPIGSYGQPLAMCV